MITRPCKECKEMIIYAGQADMNRRNKTGYCRKCFIINFPVMEKSAHWKGGKIKNDAGYIMIRKINHPFVNAYGYVREHRLVMEKYLGRYLKKDEIIHHINGIKDDNRIENLELTTQPEHARFHHTTGRSQCIFCKEESIARNLCKKHYWIYFLKAHRAAKKI